MGYGFSLFRNPSDHCNLALGAMAVARIKHVANQRKLASVSTDRSESKDLSDKPMIANKSKNGMPPGPFRSGIGWVRLVSYSHAGFSLEPKAPSFMFSEGFLQQASIAFFNIREEQTAIPISDADVCSPTLTRNKLHTVCAIAMMLQKQCSDIIAGNSSLPVWPRNQRQFYAARYRRGQLRILRSVSGSMIGSLRRIVGLTSSLPRDRRIMRLEHILKAAPKEFLQDFRAAIHVALGTRDAKKIRQQNLTESAFTLWLCGLWLWSLPITDSDSKRRNRPSLPTRTEDWVAFVDTTYSDHSVIGKRWARIPASEEGQLLAESHHSIVKAAAAKNPQSIYGHPEATTDRLLWCLRVIREESLVCPNLEGEVEDQADEIVLFLESGDAPL